MQFEEKLPWLASIGVNYHLGVDGLGMTMMVLSGIIGITLVFASWWVRERVRSYFTLLLLLQASVNGAIAAHDMFVLVLFWGTAVIPAALLVLGWGGRDREAAAWRLVGYWGLGTAALLVAAMTAYAASGGSSFDMDVLLKATLTPRVQLAVGVALIIAAATRLPLFPLHGWAQHVYSDAPLGVSVVIAGSASRLGAYLLLRALVASDPDASRLLAPFIAILAAISIGYAALVALRSVDLRSAAAHLAMVPGGITVFGLAALTPLSIAGLALLGVPLMASFPAETMILFGSFKTQPVWAFAVAAGLVLTAAAVAVITHRVLFGEPNRDAPGVSDASLGESWYLGVMAGALLWVGLFPGGPKLPGTQQPIFDPGLINIMSAGLSDIASPYVPPNPAATQ